MAASSFPSIPTPSPSSAPAVPSVPSIPAGSLASGVTGASAAVSNATSTISGVAGAAASNVSGAIGNLAQAASQPANLLPVTIRKKFDRPDFPGKSTVEKMQHSLMTQGQMMERSLGDAQFNIKSGMEDVKKRIGTYLSINLSSFSAMPTISTRPALLMIQIVKAVQDIRSFIKEILGLVKALVGVIGALQSVSLNMNAFIQARLNSIATLINEICNLQLPDLPAIPSFYGELNFDGFAFPKGAFKFAVKFDSKFAFGNCKFRTPNLDIFRNYPPTRFALDPSGHFGVANAGNPPLPNASWAPVVPIVGPPAIYTYKDWLATQPASILATPVLRPDWVPSGGFVGTLPYPKAILTPYAIPFDELREQVVSLLGGPFVDLNPGGISGIDANHTEDYWKEQLQPAVRAFCANAVTLENLVDSDWDWRVAWAWLVYVHQCRDGRGGTWIPAFQTVYEELVAPCYLEISGMPVPWHSAPDDPTLISQGPADPISLVRILTGMASTEQHVTLWKLSYIEAAMLGIPRSTRWDSFEVPGYIDGPTRNDLDYRELPMGSSEALLTYMLDSQGLANYPSSIIDVPQSAHPTVEEVILLGYKAICGAPGYVAPKASNRYVYTQLAEAVEINAHSQFWKEFKANWILFRTMPAALQAICFNYPLVLDSILNPLTASPGLFPTVKEDYLNRVSGWVMGTPYLPTPFIRAIVRSGPSLLLDASVSHNMADVASGTGGMTNDPNNSVPSEFPVPIPFDRVAFLARPDIQALPPNYQNTLVYLVQAYSDLSDYKAKANTALVGQWADAWNQGRDAMDFAEEMIGGYKVTEEDYTNAVEFTGTIDGFLNATDTMIQGFLNPDTVDPDIGLTYYWREVKRIAAISLAEEKLEPAEGTGTAHPAVQDPALVFFLEGLITTITHAQNTMWDRTLLTQEVKDSLKQALVDNTSIRADLHDQRAVTKDVRQSLGKLP